jgi:long-chain acyl-CoA synthetase
VRPHLATLLDDFRRHGAGRAVVHHSGSRSLPTTYAELAEHSGRFAAELHRRGIEPGERVLLWGQNSAAWIAAFYGCMLRGILVVPLDAAGDHGFAERVIAGTAPRLIVGDQSLLAQLAPAFIPIPQLALATSLDQLPPPEPTAIRGLNRDTPLQIIFTSGTTSEPKGIVHTHGNVLASLDPIEREMARYLRYERPFHPLRFLHTLPLSHVFGQFMGLWVPPLLAAEVHFETRLDAPRITTLIRTHRISVLAAVPRVLELLRTHLVQMDPALPPRLQTAHQLSALARWWRFRRQHRLLGLKFWAFVCGGATLPLELEEFWAGLGFALIQGYGMTETTALVTLNHPFHSARGSIGQPLAGREVRVAEDGEIMVRGDSVANAEWRQGRMHSRSGEAGHDAGWLRTGDLAAHSATGELVFTGRKSEVIVTSAGLNIHPQDLEAALDRQPGIRAACVFAWPSETGPQAAAALLIDPAANAEAAVASANSTLADYQQIRRWLIWPEPDFPRTSTGKVRRREVAAGAAIALQSTGGGTSLADLDDSLLRLVREIPGVSSREITDDSRLKEDLGLDSLGLVELQSALEQRFAAEIPEGAWQQVRTVGDLRTLIGVSPANSSAAIGAPQSSAAPPIASLPAQDKTIYPRWPWTAPVRWMRIAFQEAVAVPLTGLLLGLRVERPAAIRARSPMILIANHVTAFDVPIVLAALPPKMRRATAVAMAGGLLMGWRHARTERHPLMRPLAPLAYWLVTALFNVFPLPQGVGFRRSFAHAGAALDRGMHVLIFPEGRRSPDGSMASFQPGIGLLARDAGASVLPIYLLGLGELKQRTRHWLRSQSVTVRVGVPLTMKAGETPQQFTTRLEAAMRELALDATN